MEEANDTQVEDGGTAEVAAGVGGVADGGDASERAPDAAAPQSSPVSEAGSAADGESAPSAVSALSAESVAEPAPKENEPAQLNVAGARPEIVVESGEGGDELKLYLGEFAGPLDLLLYLIRQEQVDIYDIPIARITDTYLQHLRALREMDISVASEFLVMAAQLIEIKSRMLLPADPLAPGEEGEQEDPRRELVERLLEHQKFKAAAQMLWSRATVEQGVFTRAPIETDKNNPEVAVGVFDLLRVFQEILARRKQEVLMEIERDEVTLAQMLERLRNMIMSAGELNMRVFFERAQSRRELVLAFLSILELVRTTEVTLTQSETFGDIIARVSG
jgi:segregation and condensation protein A